MVTHSLGQRGFTAIEAMVVVAIVGILAAFAMPSMTALLTTQAVRSSAYDLMSDLTFARNEAIGRGTDVTIQGNSTTDWKQGWTITEAAGGTTLRVQQASNKAMTFTATSASVTFDRRGRPSAAGTVSFSIVPVASDAQTYQKRCISLDPSGRARAVEGACP